MSASNNFLVIHDEKPEESRAAALDRLDAIDNRIEANSKNQPFTPGDEDRDFVSTFKSSSSTGGKNENNVMGGYKATLKNPNVSEGAKQKAENVLRKHGAMPDN